MRQAKFYEFSWSNDTHRDSENTGVLPKEQFNPKVD
jgi:hypothetical protein